MLSTSAQNVVALKQPIYQYVPSAEVDYSILLWQSRLLNDGEFGKTFSKPLEAPSAFLMFFQSRPLFFQVDEFNNIQRAAWFEPWLTGLFMGFYIHPSMRHTEPKQNILFLHTMLDMALQTYPVVIGMIQERPTPEETEKFLKLHERLGYERIGKVPYLFDNQTAHFVAITRENFNGRRQKRWGE